MRAIDRLKAAVTMQPVKKAVDLPDGTEFEFWMSPLTIAQRNRAQKNAGTDDAIAFALQLLVMVAKDENGQPMFTAAELPEMRNAIPASVVDQLLLVMLGEDEEEEEEDEISPKPSRRGSRRTAS